MPGSQGGGGELALASSRGTQDSGLLLLCCRNVGKVDKRQQLKLTLRPLWTVRQYLKSTQVAQGAVQSESCGVRGAAPSSRAGSSHRPQHRSAKLSAGCKILCHVSWKVLKVTLHLTLSELPAPPPWGLLSPFCRGCHDFRLSRVPLPT